MLNVDQRSPSQAAFNTVNCMNYGCSNRSKEPGGDLGYYTADGCFYVCGRLKEMIKCMDQQVAPAELEELLCSDPEVRHVVVVGVPHPQYGEAARAFVVPRRLLQPGSLEEQREAPRLRELVAGHLAAHKHLYGGVEFSEEVPRSANGKDLRSSLKEAYVQSQCKGVKTNSLTQHLNKTIADMLAMFVEAERKTWDTVPPYVVFIYNTAVQETTQMTWLS